MSHPPILIVGAGPTGLNLALRLARAGVAFRLIDEQDGPAHESRALAVHARTLEFYDQLGFADEIVASGTKVGGIRLHENGREITHIPLGDIGEGLSRFPFILDFPQDEHERFLVAKLAEAGITVERNTALRRFTQDETGIDAVLVRQGVEEHCRFDWLCGCDGARSAVRQGLGVGFGGGTYSHIYYVADVKLADPDRGHDFHLATGPQTFALRLPARRGEMQRLIGFAPDGIEHPSFDDVKPSAERLLQVQVAELNWFSTYRVHHRVADRFHLGRAFLLGDAGHLHSPVGGQGMNTGIGDAVNLAWKLAAVVRGESPPALLDTYEPERIRFARQLVATTDRLFQMVVSEGVAGKLFRTLIMPTAIPLATSLSAGRHALFRAASQIAIHYPDSALSSGKAGHLSGGDRLPWLAHADNHAPLRSCTWQIHIYGAPNGHAAAIAQRNGLGLHLFPRNDAARQAGFAQDAAYVIRPDGYIGLAAPAGQFDTIPSYLARHLRHASGS